MNEFIRSHATYNCITHLEHMESLKLYVFTFLSQHIHHKLKVFLITNIPSHHIKVMPV